MLLSLQGSTLDETVNSELFQLGLSDLKSYARSSDYSDLLIKNTLNKEINDNGISIIFGTESSKPYLSDFMSKLDRDEKIDTTIGVIASSVTNLHIPRILYSSIESNHKKIEKHTSGIIGLNLRGDIDVQTVIVSIVFILFLNTCIIQSVGSILHANRSDV